MQWHDIRRKRVQPTVVEILLDEVSESMTTEFVHNNGSSALITGPSPWNGEQILIIHSLRFLDTVCLDTEETIKTHVARSFA